MKRQKANSLDSITWSELRKQSIQAKKFNWASRSWVGHLLQDQPLKCWPRLATVKGDPDPAFPLFFSRESRIPNFSHALFRILFFFPNPYPCQILPNPASRVAFKSHMPPYILEKSQAREYPSRNCETACVNTVQI